MTEPFLCPAKKIAQQCAYFVFFTCGGKGQCTINYYAVSEYMNGTGKESEHIPEKGWPKG